MTFEVEVAGRARSVSVEKAGREGGYRVTVDRRAFDVDAGRAGAHTLLLTSGAFPPEMSALSTDSHKATRG